MWRSRETATPTADPAPATGVLAYAPRTPASVVAVLARLGCQLGGLVTTHLGYTTLGLLLTGVVAHAEVFHAKDEALALAFPGATDVAPTTVFLTDAQVTAVKERAGVALDSRLFTYYVGRKESALLGYAVIETHVVRTLPETVLIVLTPTGHVERLILLAFYEPREYMPPPRWLERFAGRDLDPGGGRLGYDLHGISGATLTARGITQGVRKVLVLYAVAIAPHPDAK